MLISFLFLLFVSDILDTYWYLVKKRWTFQKFLSIWYILINHKIIKYKELKENPKTIGLVKKVLYEVKKVSASTSQ